MCVLEDTGTVYTHKYSNTGSIFGRENLKLLRGLHYAGKFGGRNRILIQQLYLIIEKANKMIF